MFFVWNFLSKILKLLLRKVNMNELNPLFSLTFHLLRKVKICGFRSFLFHFDDIVRFPCLLVELSAGFVSANGDHLGTAWIRLDEVLLLPRLEMKSRGSSITSVLPSR
jgi:hypothetical protein